MPDTKVTVAAKLYMVSLRDPGRIHKPNLGFLSQLIRTYSRDTIFLDLMAVVKVRDAPRPLMHQDTNFGIPTSNNIGDRG